MIFKPEMVEKILAGEKTVTRRPVKPGNSLHGPDWRPCKYEAGKDYAVQPGRGKKAVARLRVLSVERERLGVGFDGGFAEAHREGFSDWNAFSDYWAALYGTFEPDQLVDRIEFALVPTQPERGIRVSADVKPREWDYFPGEDGSPFKDKDGNEVLGWEDRREGEDEKELLAAFEAYEGRPLQLRPILARWASDVECRINGWEEGSFTRCTTRAKNPFPLWQIEARAGGDTQ